MTAGFILQLSDKDKLPGFYAQSKFGVGGEAGVGQIILLLVGLKADGLGSLALDTAPTINGLGLAQTLDDCDALAGAGGELARMGYVAIQNFPNVPTYLAAVTPGGGAAAATATITIGGAWTTFGSWDGRVGGEAITVGISPTDTPTSVAANIAAYIHKRSRMICDATTAPGVVATLTVRSSGVRGNDVILIQDKTNNPAGMTSVIAGGAAVASGGVRFTGGAGTEDVTALLAALYNGRWHRIAPAQKDSTALAKWVAQQDSKAGYDQGRMEHAVFCTNAIAQPTSLAQTNLDDWRDQLVWYKNCETPAPEIAAGIAALRASIEGATPNVSYDGVALPWVFPNVFDLPATTAVLRSCLDQGITPLNTTPAQRAVIVRSVTTRSQDASGNVDDRTIDTSSSVVPDRVRDDQKVFWVSDFVKANPFVRDNPSPEEAQPPAGVATPRLWISQYTKRLLDMQQQQWITAVEKNPMTAVFNKIAGRIASRTPVVVLPIQHQMESSVEQLNFATANT